jgi:hypothetical protein
MSKTTKMAAWAIMAISLLLITVSCGTGGSADVGCSDGTGYYGGTGHYSDNLPPSVYAGHDLNVTTGSVVNLKGSGYDIEGSHVSCTWEFLSVPAGSEAVIVNTTTFNPSFVADLDGRYVISLRVHDGDFGSSDSVTVTAVTPVAVPDTGQRTSYTSTFGEDSDYTINPPSYMLNGDGTVSDAVTGLMWQRRDDGVERTWSDADAYCFGLTLAGYGDWRVPSVKELASIAHYENPLSAIDAVYFPDAYGGPYWSYTETAEEPGGAWFVDFGTGEASYGSKMTYRRIRCVRGQERPGGSFFDVGDGTVTDNATGLTWQKESQPNLMTWEEALLHCEGLLLAGHYDWRLPNVKELSSIVVFSRRNPATDAFYLPVDPETPGSAASRYWSSTVSALKAHEAFAVDFEAGNALSYLDSERFYVRCVRGQ